MNIRLKEELEKEIEALRPWRYPHSHEGISITSDSPAAQKVYELYGRDLLTHILKVLLKDKDPGKLRALDLGCLEGHYSEILCSLNLKEVVSVDLSQDHIKRANFLLKKFKRYPNSRVLQGNVSDEVFMSSLGKFNIVLFHGLLYHLKDPLRVFDFIEKLFPKDEDFFLLLSTQHTGKYSVVLSPYPIAEMQLKPLKSLTNGALTSPKDGSIFERCSLRLNPAAVHAVLKRYNYQEMIAYDIPKVRPFTFQTNLIVAKDTAPGLTDELNKDVEIPAVRFYEWDGSSVSSYRLTER